MATIDIFPLNISGVQPPLNLLASILSYTGATNNFRYPLDLGANPNYGHAVTFSAYQRQFLGLKESLNNPINNLNNTQGAPTTISLYLPDTLNVNYSHNYGEVSLTEQLGPITTLASAFADRKASMRGLDGDSGNWWNPYAKGTAAYGLGKLGQLGSVAPGLGDVAQNAIGNVTNPHLQMLYKGVGLREFQFEFLFTPSSSQEAQQVDALINQFVWCAAPDIVSGTTTSRHYLEPPWLFNIGFSFLGGSGLSSAVTSFFSNLGTQIIGEQLTGALSSGLTQSLNNAKIYTVHHPCVLKDINVDYAPNGWASYKDGYPIQTRLTLQFKETDIVTKQDILPKMATQSTPSIKPVSITPSPSSRPYTL